METKIQFVKPEPTTVTFADAEKATVRFADAAEDEQRLYAAIIAADELADENRKLHYQVANLRSINADLTARLDTEREMVAAVAAVAAAPAPAKP